MPAIYDSTVADEALAIHTEDAYRMVKRMAREEAMLVSISAGAALQGCRQVAAALPRDRSAVIVTVLADSGEKYLSERFWEDDHGSAIAT